MSTKRKTTQEFINDARKVHGNKYDYSKVDYKNQLTKVCIICPIHGEFWQQPKCHLQGHGCYGCGRMNFGKSKRCKKQNNIKRKNNKSVFKNTYVGTKINQNNFKEFSKIVHCDKYDYSKVEYINNHTKVCIVCPEHGEFWQTPHSHLSGHGCNICGHKITTSKQKVTKEEFLCVANEKYQNKYDYSKIEYNDYNTKVCIICPEHGEFWQTPKQHLKACGCKGCLAAQKRRNFAMANDEFIKRAIDKFNGKYSYENVYYINNSTKVRITCPYHGDFLCTPANHLKGRGCPICKAENFVYEERMFSFLKTFINEKEITRQYRDTWLTHNKSLDFYLPKYKIAIEHQGEQHFNPVDFLGGVQKHKRCVELDEEKYYECLDNGIHLFYFTYDTYHGQKYFSQVYVDEQKLKNDINKLINKKNE